MTIEDKILDLKGDIVKIISKFCIDNGFSSLSAKITETRTLDHGNLSKIDLKIIGELFKED